MKRLAVGLLASALAAAAFVPLAHAADMAVPVAPAPAPVYRPALYDWTGFYVGGHVGAGLLEEDFNPTSAAASFTPAGGVSVGPAGVVAGAQAGVNYEFAPWVVGLEASWSDTGMNGSAITPVTGGPGLAALFAGLGPVAEREKSSPQWLVTATGRAGYAADVWLFYVKGGGAWMKSSYTQDILVSGIDSSYQTIDDTRSGFVVGAGVEYGLTESFSAKVEYDFYDFGTANYAFINTPVSVKSEVHTFTFGINYRYNWAGGRPW